MFIVYCCWLSSSVCISSIRQELLYMHQAMQKRGWGIGRPCQIDDCTIPKQLVIALVPMRIAALIVSPNRQNSGKFFSVTATAGPQWRPILDTKSGALFCLVEAPAPLAPPALLMSAPCGLYLRCRGCDAASLLPSVLFAPPDVADTMTSRASRANAAAWTA